MTVSLVINSKLIIRCKGIVHQKKFFCQNLRLTDLSEHFIKNNAFKGVLLCSFYKVLILFWGCTRTCSHAWWFENRIIFHIIYIITIPFSPASHGSISSGFDEGPPSEKRNVLWLVSCPSALWLANSLDGVSVLPRPLSKQQVSQYCHINSDLENIEDCAEPLHALILQVVTLLLLFFG